MNNDKTSIFNNTNSVDEAVSENEAVLNFIQTKNSEILGYRAKVKACYKTGNETEAKLKTLLSFNTTESSCLSVVYQLNECQDNLRNETAALHNVLEEVLKNSETKTVSYCEGYGVLSNYLLCPIENTANYLLDQYWNPLPTPAKIAIGTALIATAVYAGYSYSNMVNRAAFEQAQEQAALQLAQTQAQAAQAAQEWAQAQAAQPAMPQEQLNLLLEATKAVAAKTSTLRNKTKKNLGDALLNHLPNPEGLQAYINEHADNVVSFFTEFTEHQLGVVNNYLQYIGVHVDHH